MRPFLSSFLVCLVALALAGCGQSVDELEARADFKEDYNLWKANEAKLQAVGIRLHYHQPGTTEVEAVQIDEEFRIAFDLTSAYLTARARVKGLEKYVKDSEEFIGKHDKFLKNRPLWRAIKKAIDATKAALEETKKLFAAYPPTNPASDAEIESRAAALTTLEQTLRRDFGVQFVVEVERLPGRALYVSAKHDADAWTAKDKLLNAAQKSERNDKTRELKRLSEEYLRLVETDHDEKLATNILSLRVKALEDLVATLP